MEVRNEFKSNETFSVTNTLILIFGNTGSRNAHEGVPRSAYKIGLMGLAFDKQDPPLMTFFSITI